MSTIVDIINQYNGDVDVRIHVDDDDEIEKFEGLLGDDAKGLHERFGYGVDEIASCFRHHTVKKYADGDAAPDLPEDDDDDDFDGMVNNAKAGLPEPDDDDEDDVREVGKFEINKTDDEKRQVFGWAYITHDKDGKLIVDKSGESIPDVAELEKAAYGYVLKSCVQGDMHRRTLDGGAVQAGVMIESMVFTPEKIAKMGLPAGSLPTGWWVGFQITNDAIWQEVKKGNRRAFSIHGKGSKRKVKN